MRYKSGEVFEEIILGPRSGGYQEYKLFSDCVMSLVEQNEAAHPDTRIGRILYHSVKFKLDRAGVNTDGLVLINSVGQRMDYHHETDAFFFLPEFLAVATIDLFNLDVQVCDNFRQGWDLESCCPYGEAEFQCDLYSYKKNKGVEYLSGCHKIFMLPRRHHAHPRPENHFILTPYHTEFRENRERFCSLVADFLIKSSKKDQKTT